MKNTHRRLLQPGVLLIVFAAISSVALTSPSLPGAAGRAITEMDLFQFTWIADPQISPDGSRVAFVKVWVNARADRYESAVWMAVANGSEPPRSLTAGPRDLSPQWSPDGKRLAFIRSVEKDGKVQPAQIYILPLDTGGEAFALTEMPRGAGAFRWSPDSGSIVFASTATAEDFSRKDEAAKAQRGGDESGADQLPPHESDVRVITRAVYRSNGSGYSDPGRPTHLWRIKAAGMPGDMPKARQLTSGQFSESNFRWSADGMSLYFTSDRRVEPYYEPPSTALYRVSADGGDISKVAAIEGGIGAFAFAPDGKRVAFTGTLSGRPVRSFSQPDLFLAEAGGTPKNLTASYDFDIGGGIGGDQRAPRGGGAGGPVWIREGRSIVTVVAEQGRANLKRIDAATGAVTPLTTGDHDVQSYTATPDGSKLAVLVSTPTRIADLFLVDGATGQMKRLAGSNEELFPQLNLTAPEEIWYQSFDGMKINGWILKPPDFDPGKKYPLILQIHGGPHSAYGYTFTHEFLLMAARGYVVLYTNPRGSSSYGQEFGNIIQFHYPGDDYKDLMAGVDEMIRRGYIDERRLGVTGGSGGGVLTNWVVGHTGRFAAAVSQRSIADWSGFWYTADFTLFQPTWFRGAPWEDPADFTARSPITHVKNVTTPMMFIEGEADYRTPPADGGEVMFRALKYRRIPTVMVRFPGESHELSRSGNPWHRVERLQHILNWFDKYLLGKPMTIYDVQ